MKRLFYSTTLAAMLLLAPGVLHAAAPTKPHVFGDCISRGEFISTFHHLRPNIALNVLSPELSRDYVEILDSRNSIDKANAVTEVFFALSDKKPGIVLIYLLNAKCVQQTGTMTMEKHLEIMKMMETGS